MKKYELTTETMSLPSGLILHRIRALSNFGNVKAGDFGGWIESENNLSREEHAWVGDNAKVYGGAYIVNNALVSENASVCGEALVCGKAVVRDNARVCDNAVVRGGALVCDKAEVHCDACVCDNAKVFGNAWILGRAQIRGDATIGKDAHYLTAGPIGSRNDFITFTRNKHSGIDVTCGCFFGSIEKFLKTVEETHGTSKHAETYKLLAELAKKQIEDIEEDCNNA